MILTESVSKVLFSGGRAGVIINEHVLDPVQTRRHVDILSRWFELIGVDDLDRALSRPGRRPFCILTFDDGKRSNATQTAPELERLGVPAVFYITTRFVGGKGLLWFDRYEALRRSVAKLPRGLNPGLVKQLPLDLLETRLKQAISEEDLPTYLSGDDYQPMSWDQALSLSKKGFTIGAHGTHHAVLTNETEHDALLDISDSMNDVRERLGRSCRTFAFPNGNYTARLALHAHALGAETVMTTEPTWVDPRSARWRLPRIQLFPGTSAAQIRLKLAAAAAGGLLKNPDGTGRAYSALRRLS
jgi:peptidoglycan/xylan/chitin deacetylase (PgdA/CDA1 family)